MTSIYTPGNGVPLPEENKPGGGCLKWGGIGAGLLILLSIAGSCGGGDGETIIETQTVTVTTEVPASTVTTTVTTSAATAETTSPAVEQPQEQHDEATANDSATPEEDDTQRAQFFAPAPAPEQPAPAQVSFANCSEARNAGAAPLYAGDPGYSSKLDRDGDGIACE